MMAMRCGGETIIIDAGMAFLKTTHPALI